MGIASDVGNWMKEAAADLGEWLKETAKERTDIRVVAAELLDGVTDKFIPQGAAEVSSALFTGQGYSPYGSPQQSIGLESGEVADPAPEPAPTTQEMYEQNLAIYADRGGQEPGIER